MEQTVRKSQKKVWLPIILVLLAGAVVVVLLALGLKALSDGGRKPAPVLVASESRYTMYEIRNNSILLVYKIALRNDTDTDMENLAMRAVLQKDYKSGFLLKPDANVGKWGEEQSFFTIPAGQTVSFDMVLEAPYYPGGDAKPSKSLPDLYAIYPDGSEGKVTFE